VVPSQVMMILALAAIYKVDTSKMVIEWVK
jgi:hypothetical protein